MAKCALICGAGGFIGHHLVSYLKDRGYWVRGVDIKEPEYEPTRADEFELLDLRRWGNCLQATRGIDQVYNLAANMGGIGFIEHNKAVIMHDNVLINIHMLEASRLAAVKRFLFTSSACVYPQHLQKNAQVTALREDDAYPADPEDGYAIVPHHTFALVQFMQRTGKLKRQFSGWKDLFFPEIHGENGS